MWHHTYILYSDREIWNTYPSTCNILHIEFGKAGRQSGSQAGRWGGLGWVGGQFSG